MEILIAAVVGLLVLRNGAAPKTTATAKPAAAPKPPANSTGVDTGAIGGVVVSGIGAAAAIFSTVVGGGTAVVGGSAAAAGGGAAATTKTAVTTAAVGASISGAAVAAVAIVVVWVVLVVAAGFQLIDAASRRAWRAGLGAAGLRELTAATIRKSEHAFALKLVNALGGVCQLTEAPLTQVVPRYMMISSVSGLTQEQMIAVGTVARFMAIEQVRALTDSVRGFFAREFGATLAQVAANGDAMEAGDFDQLVADYYQGLPLLAAGEPTAWVTAAALVPPLVAAQARFGGRMAAITYVNAQLAGGSLYPSGVSATDQATAAAANPPGDNTVAYTNRVFGLGQEQKASVLFDNDARLAWLPKYSYYTLAFFPYESKPFVGLGTGQ